jgi:hypothetical protein
VSDGPGHGAGQSRGPTGACQAVSSPSRAKRSCTRRVRGGPARVSPWVTGGGQNRRGSARHGQGSVEAQWDFR